MDPVDELSIPSKGADGKGADQDDCERPQELHRQGHVKQILTDCGLCCFGIGEARAPRSSSVQCLRPHTRAMSHRGMDRCEKGSLCATLQRDRPKGRNEGSPQRNGATSGESQHLSDWDQHQESFEAIVCIEITLRGNKK